MRIIVASTIVPFIDGGGRLIVTTLATALREYGHDVEVVSIPFISSAPHILEQMLALRLMDLEDRSDLLIAIRNPSHILKHPNKVLWFIHHYRMAYDLWGTIYQDIPDTPEGWAIRNAIIQSDNKFLGEAKRIYTNSKVVSERLKRFNGIESEVLYPPLMDAERYRCGEFQDYILYVSRITHIKRQYLAIEAMRHVNSGVRLVVAGAPDAPEQLEYIKSMATKYRLQGKVELLGSWISEEQKRELFANALGCLYIPYDEDSYGYPTLESFHSRKPVITCTDSGGTLEIIEDGVNGFVVQPDAKHLAVAMDRLMKDRANARRMGRRGYDKLRVMNISWEKVVASFTG